MGIGTVPCYAALKKNGHVLSVPIGKIAEIYRAQKQDTEWCGQDAALCTTGNENINAPICKKQKRSQDAFLELRHRGWCVSGEGGGDPGGSGAERG